MRCTETTRNDRVGASSVPNVGFFLELGVREALHLTIELGAGLSGLYFISHFLWNLP